eukprot:scaffold36997_cov16-Tisochrysis_lutea.AAC.2
MLHDCIHHGALWKVVQVPVGLIRGGWKHPRTSCPDSCPVELGESRTSIWCVQCTSQSLPPQSVPITRVSIKRKQEGKNRLHGPGCVKLAACVKGRSPKEPACRVPPK